jgi:CheY-like chemotaxis protein
MSKQLKNILLIDDNFNDNFFHERAIKKVDPTITVIAKNSGPDALEYLKSKQNLKPDLILLDINMPGMNGWDFLQKYILLDKEAQSDAPIMMLTTSENPDDIKKVQSFSILADYFSKPLTKEIMEDIKLKYFQ